MKRLFTLFMFAMASLTAFAQFPNESPYPGEFRVISPTVVSGTYDVGRQVAWGDTLTETVCGDLVWAYGTLFDSTGNIVSVDSLCCQPVLEDLTGKIAVIRRGVCNFSLKAYHAQQAGAVGVVIVNHYANAADTPTTLVNMSAGDSATAVHIPAVFFGRQSGEAIVPLIDAGETVNACFYVPNYAYPNAGYAYATPADETLLLEDVGATYYNLSTEETTINAQCVVTDPTGASTTLTETIVVPAATDTAFTFTDNYEVTGGAGTYSFMYTYDGGTDTLYRTMEVTESLYSHDNLVIDDYAAVDSATFFSGGLLFDVGSFYLSGGGTHPAYAATFAVRNIETFLNDKFSVVLYDLDSDGDGQLPNPFDYTNTTQMAITAFEEVIVSDTMNNDELITVTFSEPVFLTDSSAYGIMLRYDGNESGLGIVPQYSVGGREAFRTINTMVYAGGTFYTGGWSSNENNVVRLHVGEPPVNTDNIKSLDANKISAFPTPASDFVNVKLDLEGVNDNAVIRLVDLQGRVINQFNLTNVQSGTYRFDVRDVPAGHYFINAETNEGFRAIKVQVAH